MKKFRFPLETLKMQRRILQDLSQKDYQEGLGRLKSEQSRKEKMRTDVLESLRRTFEDQHEKQGSPLRLQLGSEFVHLQDLRMKNQDAVIAQTQAEVETLQEILRRRAIDHKIIERLKEKQKEEHRKEVEKIRQKNIDDINTMRFRRKGSG
ncbi:MAG: flagellar FliJ family protein [Bdellovibrio sp.]